VHRAAATRPARPGPGPDPTDMAIVGPPATGLGGGGTSRRCAIPGFCRPAPSVAGVVGSARPEARRPDRCIRELANLRHPEGRGPGGFGVGGFARRPGRPGGGDRPAEPADPQHPREDLLEAPRRGIRARFPEGRLEPPRLRTVPA
jgi:hypothetical protein